MAQVWLVTGSSRGLGRAIVEAGLAAGNKVLETARGIESLADLPEPYGDQLKLRVGCYRRSSSKRGNVGDQSIWLVGCRSSTRRDMAIFRPSKTRLYRNCGHRSKRISSERLL